MSRRRVSPFRKRRQRTVGSPTRRSVIWSGPVRSGLANTCNSATKTSSCGIERMTASSVVKFNSRLTHEDLARLLGRIISDGRGHEASVAWVWFYG